MMILALEFSSARRSVALAHHTGSVLAEAVESSGGRRTNGLWLIEKVLVAANIPRSSVGVLAVGLGPGSYAGIRAAIAIAQGWQLARGANVLGIRSTESLAAEAQTEKLFGRVNLVVDAQRGDFYLSAWDISCAARRELSGLRIISSAELETRRASGEICAGPDTERPLFPTAAMIATIAQTKSDFVSAEALEPVYLRETGFVKTTPGRNLQDSAAFWGI
jgi:tRNA threonylcarbamoyladenosine biosynthesis protein TsaB